MKQKIRTASILLLIVLGTGLVLHLLNNGIIAATTLAERGMG